MNFLEIDIDSDEEHIYHPVWLDQPRGFVNLRAKESVDFNRLIDTFLPSQIVNWACSEDGWTFEFDDMTLHIFNPPSGQLYVIATTPSIHREYIDPLRVSLRQLLARSLETLWDVTSFAIVLLQLTEEVVLHMYDWPPRTTSSVIEAGKGWDASEIRGISCLYENADGLNLDTIDESGGDILGTSIKKICEELPSEYRVLHAEPVFRVDLVARFRRAQRKIRESLSQLSYGQLRKSVSMKTIPKGSTLDKHHHLVEELSRPSVSFHGTQRTSIASIVRHGFLKPGDKIGDHELDIRCGASFGIGVYSSPSPEYAMFYAHMARDSAQKTTAQELPGLRLIVCAVLMGRSVRVTRNETRMTASVYDESAHSHVSPDQNEYVVFDAAQIIPCYVLHLDLGAEAAREALLNAADDPASFVRSRSRKQHPKLSAEVLFPADVQRKKDARKEAALKWFPYGFGPATGTQFVIEEVAECSDDEEEYGEWQGTRKEVGKEVREWEERGQREGASWFDEYQKSRSTYKGQRKMEVVESDEDD